MATKRRSNRKITSPTSAIVPISVSVTSCNASRTDTDRSFTAVMLIDCGNCAFKPGSTARTESTTRTVLAPGWRCMARVMEFSPHFPGYPAFIWLARLINLAVDDPAAAVQWASLLGTALIGSILLTGLGAAFVKEIQNTPSLPPQVRSQIVASTKHGLPFVPAKDVTAKADKEGLSAQAASVTASYAQAQVDALKVAMGGVAALVLLAMLATRGRTG